MRSKMFKTIAKKLMMVKVCLGETIYQSFLHSWELKVRVRIN
jgi:hypothetical protein